tara:strand:+ start:151 stop:576 length:426 start_codon:yes stop_codon:yes gene_type:complete
VNIEEKIGQIKADYCKAFSNFSAEVGECTNWYYDLDDLFIELTSEDNTKRFNVIPVGSYSTEFNSFLWSWANEDLSEHTRSKAAKLKSLYSEFPFKAFQVKGFNCKQEELDEILSLSLYHLNGKVIFKIKDESPWLFLCVL